ncbi:MAG: hypothetical protein KGI54_16410, partial [Pseudomonadota bacterium]|nr:hypothetical protein [Pseudomonadota bacterium]
MRYTLDDILKLFGSKRNAARQLGFDHKTMCRHLNNHGYFDTESAVAYRQLDAERKEAAKRFKVLNQGEIQPVKIPRSEEEESARQAAQQGYAPEFDLIHPVPDGMTSRGTSIKYGEDGEIKEYWNKTKQAGRHPDEVVRIPGPRTIVKTSTLLDQQGNVAQQWISEKPQDVAREQAWQAFADALKADLPKSEPVKAPKSTDKDLMVVIPVGDAHIGMHSWRAETGTDYDLDIAESLHDKAFTYLLDNSPNAGLGLLAFLGDITHTDSYEAVTPAHKNLLDADSRYPKIVQTTVKMVRSAINKSLAKFKKVHVIIEVGNHDPSTAIFLAICIAAIYENDPRITVDTSPAHYHYYRFGSCLIGVHHGHGAKMEQLPLIMANDRPEDWGETKHRKWLTGHIHHAVLKDFVGVTVESFRILAAPDAYAANKGYRAPRDMQA